MAAGIALAFLPALALSRNDDFTINASNIFSGYTPQRGTQPIAIEIENKGPSAQGVLRVSTESFQMDYPVELPRGARKRIVAYPWVYSGYGEIKFDLDTDRGSQQATLRSVMGEPLSKVVALVSDTEGELAFLTTRPDKQKKSTSSTGVAGVYVHPEFAPDRPMAYSGIAAVMLGPGAERITDGAVRALKLWSLAGGAIILVGGASAPVFSDPRWKDLLPLRALRTKTIQGSLVLANMGSADMTDPITLVDGTSQPGVSVVRDGSTPLIATRSYGLGKVVALTFNPFDLPLSRWPGRQAMLLKAAQLSDSARAQSYLTQFNTSLAPTDPYSYTTTMGTTGGSPYSPYTGGPRNDPFSMQLPPLKRTLTILIAYFIVIIPINFGVLRKLKRGELAWVTAPIISLAFAGIFLASARELYGAKMSTATQGLLLARQGQVEGLFYGNSQMFFPGGGSYDLKLDRVDAVGAFAQQDMYSYGRPQQSLADFQPKDVGTIKIDDLRVSNLTFKDISYVEVVPVGRWVEFDLQRKARGHATCTVRNTSPFTMKAARLLVYGNSYSIPELQSGNSKSMEVSLLVPEDSSGGSQLATFTGRSHEIALVAVVENLRVGPQIGDSLANRSQTQIAYFADSSSLGGRR